MNNITQIPTQKNLDFFYDNYEKYHDRAAITKSVVDINIANSLHYQYESLCKRTREVLGI